MRIALVDDDADFLAQTARLLALDLERRGIQAEVAAFASAEKMLTAKPSAVFDMYLLDVMMPGMDGIELARRIRRVQFDAPIVFFTTSKDFALESYSVRASGYVVKPFTHEAFAAALDVAFRWLGAARPEVVPLKTSAGFVNLELKDFVYAETDGHFVIVHTLDRRIVTVRLSVQVLWEQLGSDARFVRVGRQLLVNLARTKNFADGKITLATGETFAVPRRAISEVKDAFLRFYRG